MGATVFIGAKAYAIRLANGDVGYIWSEETYEKNCHPHTPSWCVMAIGDRKRIVKRIFDLAYSLPGGCLQPKSKISTTGFISKMMNILENSEWINKEVSVILKNDGRGFYAAISDKNREEGIKIFNAHGKHEWAEDIKVKTEDGGKNIVVNLRENFHLMATLSQSRFTVKDERSTSPVMSTWRIIDHHGLGGTVDCPNVSTRPSVEYKVTNKEKPVLECYVHHFEKTRLDFQLVFCEGKQLKSAWGYDIEQSLIKLAAEREEFSPGYYKPLLSAYKDAEKRALPMSMKFSIDVSSTAANSHMRTMANQICKALGREVTEKLVVTLQEINDMKSEEPNAQYWAVQALGDSEICSVEHPSLLVDENQLSLLDENKKLSLID